MDAPHLLCVATVAALPAQRVAITVDSTDGAREFLSASDEVAERVEWAQIMLGEGPGVSANGVGPVVVYDARSTDTPWPLFAREAEFAGVGAIYALPLRLGNIRIGVLSLYMDGSRQLGGTDLEDAIAVADMITSVLLAAAATNSVDPLDSWWDQPEKVREVHQATGMILTQLGVDAREAYVRLRAYSFARSRPLGEVAGDVVHNGLRIDTEPETIS